MRRLLILVLTSYMLAGCARTVAEHHSSAGPAPKAPVGARLDAPAATPTSSPDPGPGGAIPDTLPSPFSPEELAKMQQDAPPPVNREGFRSVSFETLASFPFNVDSQGKITKGEVLPKEIQELDGQMVAVSGYLIPLGFEGEEVTRAILVRNQLLCCYGQAPAPNEWIYVEARPPLKPITEIPVTLYGWLEAGPDFEEGQFISLYRMGVSDMATEWFYTR